MVQRCIQSLRAQTRKLDAILVVDSSTQPDVRVWLETQHDVQSMFVGNEGSAGGMHHGLKRALAHDFDWMWLFDDDVVATPDALAQLLAVLERRPEFQIVNALSVREGDASRPSAGAIQWRQDPDDYLYGVLVETNAEIRTRADADGLIDTVGGQLYQGTLISKAVVRRVGVVETQFFTRGDEVEYALRIMRAGYRIPICVHSIVTHPSSNTIFLRLPGLLVPFGRMTSVKRYYSIRNSLWIRKMYYRGHPFWLYAFKRTAAGMFQELVVESDRSWRERLKGCVVVLRAARAGLRLPAAFQEPVRAPWTQVSAATRDYER